MKGVFSFMMWFRCRPAGHRTPWCCPCIAVFLRSVSTHRVRAKGVNGHTNDRATSTNLYSVLGVNPETSPSQIKGAYYRQSFLYHPDRNHGSQEAVRRFTAVVEAYTVLGNPWLRRKYDQGVLTASDIQAAERTVRSPLETAEPTPGEWRASGDNTSHGFDTFYRSTYSHQLRQVQYRRQRRKEMLNREKLSKESFMPVVVLVIAVIFIGSICYF
uniref:dnaJ homolog subfamily C member 30, mitochondrial-like n=1 Tax=Myxine glutinosa TaxID=7769 RepID=UPI0035900BD0